VIRLVSSRLPDETSEQVRRSHHEAIEELQREIRALRASAARPGWEYIDTTEYRGAATDKFVLRGDFNADRDREYEFDISMIMASGTSHRIRLGPRGAFVDATNYDTQVDNQGTIINVTEQWQLMGDTQASHFDATVRVVKHPNGPASAYGIGNKNASTPGAVLVQFACTDRNTANINAWAIGSTAATRILAGSTVTAWRRRRR
jgi:hypothetical protein